MTRLATPGQDEERRVVAGNGAKALRYELSISEVVGDASVRCGPLIYYPSPPHEIRLNYPLAPLEVKICSM